MRYIEKKHKSTLLDSYHKKPPSSSSEAKKRWRRFRKKRELENFLSGEQGSLCGYTEMNPASFGLGFHVEHVVPKSKSPDKTFDYHNLIVSILSDTDQARVDPNTGERYSFGGHFKENRYDPAKFISCLDAECEKYFMYGSDGEVKPSSALEGIEKEKAEYTIELLNLNCKTLVYYRKIFVRDLGLKIDDCINFDLAVEDLRDEYLSPKNGVLKSFYSASKQRFSAFNEGSGVTH